MANTNFMIMNSNSSLSCILNIKYKGMYCLEQLGYFEVGDLYSFVVFH